MINSRSILFLILLAIFLTYSTPSQTIRENWLPVKVEDQNKIYINVSNLSSTQKDDIYVWVLEEFNKPIELEGIDGKVYQTKTYYLMNNGMMRYSILQIIFFDENKNVLKSYNYEHNSELLDFKYNTPILQGSNAEAVLNKCLEIVTTKVD